MASTKQPTKPDTRAEDAASIRRNELAKNNLEDYRMAYISSMALGNFDLDLWKNVKIMSATLDLSGRSGTAVFQLIAPDRYSNYTGNVHGGAVATILDGCTNCTIAIISRKGFWQHSGVTRNLNITYVRPVEKGQKVIILCEVIHASSRLVTIQGIMKRDGDGAVLAMCMQEMVAIDCRL